MNLTDLLVILVYFLATVGVVSLIYLFWAFISKKLITRRYNIKNDIGRDRKDFYKSLNSSRRSGSDELELSNSKRDSLENTSAQTNGAVDRQADQFGRV